MLLVGNGKVITGNTAQPFLANGCVAVDGNVIVEIGVTGEILERYTGAEFIDAAGKIIMPGMVNAHTHVYRAFARGLTVPGQSPGKLAELLAQFWWRFDKALTLEDIYYSALVQFIDCIKNGVTTVFDHHSSPGVIRDSLFTIAKAAGETGIRSCLCYEVSDRNGEEAMRQSIAENVEFIKHAKKLRSDTMKAMFGLHASHTLEDASMDDCCEANPLGCAGFHIDTTSGPNDLPDSLGRYGIRPIQRLAGFNLLGPKTIAANCIHMDATDIEILKEVRTKIAYSPSSLMDIGLAYAPIGEMLNRGLYMGLGTDSYTNDVLESYKNAVLLYKQQSENSSVTARDTALMLWQKNAPLCREIFPRPLLCLTPGAYADMIIVDYDPPTPMNEQNIALHVLAGVTGRMVDTTIINGRVVMRGKWLLGIDEQRILARSKVLAEKLWERF